MSFSEDQLGQMVQEFMESGSSETTPARNSSSPAFSLHQHTLLLLEGLTACATIVELDLLERATWYVGNMGSKKRSSVKMKLAMRLRMDGYNASLCRSAWESTAECLGGDYEYVDVVAKGSRIIVDIDFKSQFELARPTPTYARLSAAVPLIFVGEEAKLRRMIPLLCAAVQESLREKGLHVPPWRRTAHVRSKWLSSCSRTSSAPLLQAAEKADIKGGDYSGDPRRRPQESALSPQLSDLGGCLSSAPESWRSSVAHLDDNSVIF